MLVPYRHSSFLIKYLQLVLAQEMFGNAEIDYDDIVSEDEDWGPQRRRRRTIPEDPSRPRPPRIRRRRASNGDTLNGVDAQGEGGEKRMWRRLPDSAVEVCLKFERLLHRRVCVRRSFLVT